MAFHLRLLYHTVMAAKRRKELSSVRLASSLYLWLCRRILHSSKIDESQKFLGMSKDVELHKETYVSYSHILLDKLFLNFVLVCITL